MTLFEVTVRNAETAEQRVVEVDGSAGCLPAAQIDALHTMFTDYGWNRGEASVPQIPQPCAREPL